MVRAVTCLIVLQVAVGDPASDLQRQVDNTIVSCRQQLGCELVVPRAEYVFGNRTFSIRDAKGLTIRSAGATLLFAGHLGGVLLERCEDVAFAGFIIDRNPPPLIQATITGVNNSDLEYTVPSAFPTMLEQWFYMGGGSMELPHSQIFPPDDLWNSRCGGTFDPAKVSSLGGRKFKYTEYGCPLAKGGDVLLVFIWGGFTYTVANSTRVLTEDVEIRASGYMAIGEYDGGGNNTYRRVSLDAVADRVMSSNADGFHSEDVDIGPTIDGCYMSRLYDDFFNSQNTFLMVMNVSGMSLTLVHPHTNDLPLYGTKMCPDCAKPDMWYGTTEPLRRVRPGDYLLFYNPITFDFLGRVPVKATPRQMPALPNSTLGLQADGLYDIILKRPYDFAAFTPQHYRQQRFRSSVYEVEVSMPPPRTTTESLQVPYVIEIEKTRGHGAVVKNSVFEYSTGFFGRWKSSGSCIVNNTFRHVNTEELEMRNIAAFYEGPLTIEHVLVENNTFYVHGDAKDVGDIISFDPKFVHGVVTRGNRVLHESATKASADINPFFV